MGAPTPAWAAPTPAAGAPTPGLPWSAPTPGAYDDFRTPGDVFGGGGMGYPPGMLPDHEDPDSKLLNTDIDRCSTPFLSTLERQMATGH
jgi:hypothetical protein